jgi:ParB-like partition proteins
VTPSEGEGSIKHSSDLAKLGARPTEVMYLATNKLHPNPHNPRVLFDPLPMDELRESIRKVGILVPLTVYQESASNRYVILDGQRRWMCATAIGLRDVPVNQVPEPSLIQNIVTMFQIHKLRQDWELMPTALKVGLLMKETGDRSDKTLSALTGLDKSMISRCKKLLSYDKRYQDMMLDPNPEKRVRADFFIELYAVAHDREVVRFKWFRRQRFVGQMLDKYLTEPKTIKAVTDFRLVKQHITNARRAHATREFSKRLRQFAENHDMPITHLEISEANIHADAKAVVDQVTRLKERISTMDVQKFYGEEDLWLALRQLLEAIKVKIAEADRRL